MSTAEDVKKRLETSLPPSADDAMEAAQEAIEGAAPADAADKKAVEDPRSKKNYTFTLAYQDSRGKMWAGKFVTKILSMQERGLVGTMRAALSGSQPYEALDPLSREINLMRAQLPVCLIERPKWAEKLDEIDDFTVLQAIYAEVSSHEAYFLGFDRTSGARSNGGA